MSVMPADYLAQRTRVFLGGRTAMGWQRVLDLIRTKLPGRDLSRALFIRLENGMGDQVCILGLMGAWRDHFAASAIIAIARGSSAELVSMYEGDLDLVLYFDQEPDVPYFRGESPYTVVHRPSKAHTKNGSMLPWYFCYGVSYLDQYRIGLELPPGAPFKYPTLQGAMNMADDAKILAMKDCVVLCPYSNTYPTESMDFYAKLAEHLVKAGYKVFTNTANRVNNIGLIKSSSIKSHVEIPGTEALDVSLSTLLKIGSVASAIISGVSGPPYFLAGEACFKIVIHRDYFLSPPNLREDCGQRKLIDIDRVARSYPGNGTIFDLESTSDYGSLIDQVLFILQSRGRL